MKQNNRGEDFQRKMLTVMSEGKRVTGGAGRNGKHMSSSTFYLPSISASSEKVKYSRRGMGFFLC